MATVKELRKFIVELGGDPQHRNKSDLEDQLAKLSSAESAETKAPEPITIGDLYCWDNGGRQDCVSAQGHRILVDEHGPVLGYRGRFGEFIRVTLSSTVREVEPGDDSLNAAIRA